VIFGAGTNGKQVVNHFVNAKAKFCGFCDNYKTNITGTPYDSLPIISPSRLARDYDDAIIIVAVNTLFNDIIYKQVLDMGFSADNIFRRYSGYALRDIQDIMRHYDGYEWAYGFFQDDKSKQIVLDRIRAYLFYHEMRHEPETEQYFDKNIRFGDSEVFVDGGCYDGATTLEFIRRVKGQFAQGICFEPASEMFAKMSEKLAGYQNVKIVNKGLYDRETVLHFTTDASSSRVDDNGEDSIAVTSLDEYFKVYADGLLPTFIKMDIEGSEKAALIGAEGVIRAAHPKLAICVYHKPEDIYELPKIISDYGGYDSFFLRHYCVNNNETVMYAIRDGT
jgi:FkbM family methyltransferase